MKQIDTKKVLSSFSAEPKVVHPESRYRNQQPKDQSREHQNLMFDKRVIRGNTYAKVNIQENPLQQKTYVQRKQENQQIAHNENENDDINYVLDGRVNIGVETDEFVETLTDKPPRYEQESQTEFKIEVPLQKFSIHVKTGIDQETQIWDGELFDFDYECLPTLKVLCGKTLELSRMEVLEEEELRVMKNEQLRLLNLKKQEMDLQKQLEDEENQRFEENKKQKFQYQKRKNQNVKSHQLVVSRVQAKSYLSKLKDNSFSYLDQNGIFRNESQNQLYDDFYPWLFQKIQFHLDQENQFDQILQGFSQEIKNSVEQVNKKQIDIQLVKVENYRLKCEKEAAQAESKRQRILAKERAKAEAARRAILKEKIDAEIIPRNQKKDNLSSCGYGDLHGLVNQDNLVIGLFGGIIGEIAQLFMILRDMHQDDDKVQETFSSYTQVDEIIKEYLNSKMQDAELFLSVDQKINEQLKTIQEELTLETVQLFYQNEAKANQKTQILQILLQSVHSPVLSLMKSDPKIFNFLDTENMIDMVTKSLVLFGLEYENGKCIKFQMAPQHSLSTQGLVKFAPNKIELELRDKSKIPEDDQQKLEFTLSEFEIEEKVTLIPNNSNIIKVLVCHPVAQIYLRTDLLAILTQKIKSLTNSDDLLVSVSLRTNEIEQQYLTFENGENYPTFEYDYY